MVTNACIVLHNFLLTRNDVRHNNRQTDSGAGILQRIGQQEGEGNRNYDGAREIRDEFCDYFNTNGAVEWQWSIPIQCMCQMAVDVMSLTCLLGDVRFEVKVVLFCGENVPATVS